MAFTMFDKFAEVFDGLPEEHGKELAYAIVTYGYTGEEPDLPYPINLMFALMREDLDNSLEMRSRGNKGGRPKTRKAETPKPERPETENQEGGNAETLVSETAKPMVSETAKPMVSEKPKPRPNQTIAKPDQIIAKPDQREFPSAREGGGDGDVDAFWRFVAESQGAYNRILGRDVRDFPPIVHEGLRRAWDNGRRLPDVEKAIRSAQRHWEPKFITPESVLDRHLETLLNIGGDEDDYDEYDVPDTR